MATTKKDECLYILSEHIVLTIFRTYFGDRFDLSGFYFYFTTDDLRNGELFWDVRVRLCSFCVLRLSAFRLPLFCSNLEVLRTYLRM